MKWATSPLQLLAKLALVSLLIAGTWVAWDNWGRFVRTPRPVAPAVQPNAETIAHGEYLSRIGGCVACHTAKGGDPMAGGRRIDTPFGVVFSSNLTSSNAFGLGQWTEADFQNALRWGRSRDGRLLLPVFPYNHTSVFTDDDVHAMFAWLQTVKPIEQAQPEHRLTWPLGTQPVIAVWRSLFFTPTSFKVNDTESALWNRGAYLVQSAGHCAACHGQRNALGSFPAVDDLSGGMLRPQLWFAPSLLDGTQTSLAQNSPDDIATLLRTGQGHASIATGPMAEFVQQTGQYLSAKDAQAIAVYLKSRVALSAPNTRTPTIAHAVSAPNAPALYDKHCATCHGHQGQGKAHQYPALAGNPAIVADRPENLIQMVLYGGYGASTPAHPRPYGMPPYLFTLNNQQIADVLNHIRSQWGNQATPVSPMQVDSVRAATY
ncbi:MAG: c-type cytochrome [Limnohabitans sp.]